VLVFAFGALPRSDWHNNQRARLVFGSLKTIEVMRLWFCPFIPLFDLCRLFCFL